MVDQKKRNTLKTMAAATTCAAVPAVITAAHAATTPVHSDITPVVDHIKTHMSSLGISIDVEPTPDHPSIWLRFTGASDRPVTIKHVSPGLIRSNGRVYDVNSVLDGRSLTINPDESYTWIIEPVAHEKFAAVPPNATITGQTAAISGADAPQHGDVLTPRLVLG